MEEKDYSKILTKKDLELYRDTLIAHLKNIYIDKENFEQLLTYTEKRIENFKDDIDKVIDEVTDGSAN